MSAPSSLEQLALLARLEAALEARACAVAVALGEAVEAGATPAGAALRSLREAHADWQAARAVSELAARRSPEWPLRERAATELRAERAAAQHHRWRAQIQNAEHSGDRSGELVRVLANLVAELVGMVDRSVPGEDAVNARFAALVAERDRTA